VAVVFADRISVWSLAAIAIRGRTADIWHFDPLTPASGRIVGLAARAGLIRGSVRQVDANIGELTNADGGCALIGLLRESRALSSAIRTDWIHGEPVVRALEPAWPARAVAFHLDKMLETAVREERLRIAVARRVAERERVPLRDVLILIADRPWIGRVREVASAEGLRLIGYPRLSGGRLVLRGAGLAAQLPGRVRARRARRPAAASTGSRPPAVGLRFGHRAVSLDPTRHSELFWLRPSDAFRVILYDHEGRPPAEEAKLRERGITVVGKVPLVTTASLRVAVPHWIRIGRAVLETAARQRRLPLGLAKAVASLALEHASWYTFFRSTGIRVNVVGSNGSSGQVLALDALGGTSVNYQYSIANIIGPTTLVTAGETVQLVYSGIFAELVRSLESPAKHYVITGPLSDGAVEAAAELRRSPSVRATRSTLEAGGATFVMCFFDENSADRWDVLATNAQAAKDYAFLIRWVEEDPTLGLVLKPKKPWDLRQRIGSVASRLDDLVASGRCVIRGASDSSRETFVAEAALAADLCIGKLSAGTASLEGHLIGVRSVMVDVDDLRDHPLRSLSGRVVFDGWHRLRGAVDAYRRDPAAHSDLGDWSGALADLDPFRDGGAVDRMRAPIIRSIEAQAGGVRPPDAPTSGRSPAARHARSPSR